MLEGDSDDKICGVIKKAPLFLAGGMKGEKESINSNIDSPPIRPSDHN